MGGIEIHQAMSFHCPGHFRSKFSPPIWIYGYEFSGGQIIASSDKERSSIVDRDGGQGPSLY